MASDNDFDWLAYRAKIAAVMLPVIYSDVCRSNTGMRNSMFVAIEETIDIAIEMAEKLENRLKQQ